MRPDSTPPKQPTNPDAADLLERWRQALPSRMEPVDPASPRGRILAAAREAFAAEGFEATTTRTIADRAGVNLAMVHYYFSSKEGLYRRVLGDEILQLLRSLAESTFRADHTPADRLLDFVGFINHAMRKDPVRLAIIRRELGQGAPRAPHVVQELGAAGPEGFRQVMLAAIAEEQRHGHLIGIEPSSILAVLLSSAYGLLFAEPMLRIILAVPSLDERHWQRLLSHQRDLLRRALVVPPDKETSP